MAQPATNGALVEQWVARYGVTNAILAWKQAAPGKAAEVAFRAVASEPNLLLDSEWSVAQQIADQAEQVAAHFQSEQQSPSQTMNVVSAMVLKRVREWRDLRELTPDASATTARQRLRVGRPAAPLGGAPSRNPEGLIIPKEYRDIFGNTLDDYPQFSEKTGAAVAATVAALGARDLARLKPPMDNIFAVMSARFAARCVRGAYQERAVPRETCVEIISVVQDWAARTHQTPLAVSYNGRNGTIADRARVLAYDALACVDLVAELERDQGGSILASWERVAEEHSYVAVSLNIRDLLHIDYSKIELLAAAAARFARRSIEDPTSCKLPELPGAVELLEPRALLSSIRNMLPNGTLTRSLEKSGLVTPKRPATPLPPPKLIPAPVIAPGALKRWRY